MPVSPSVQQTLAADLSRGMWQPVTTRFWETTLQGAVGATPTPTLLATLRSAFATGVWPPVVLATLRDVWPHATPAVLRTLQQDFQQGRWSGVTLRTLEGL